MGTTRSRADEARLLLDTGAAVAVARGDARARAHVDAAYRRGWELVVPAVVVAETYRDRSRRDDELDRLLAAVADCPPADLELAREAGRLLASRPGVARIGALYTLDALVAAEALLRGGSILSTDPPTLVRLLAGAPVPVLRV